MLSTYRMVMDAILIGLLLYTMSYSGMWHTYSPRPGIECVTFSVYGVPDVDCYKLEKHDG